MFIVKKIIGMRILKTGIAVTMSLVISQLLGIPSSFAGVVALIGVKLTTKKSLHYGSTLLLGSFLSVFLGLIIGIYIGTGPIAFGLSTIIAIAILVAFRLVDGLILAVVVMYHVIEAMPISLEEFWSFSINELVIVFIGIASSVIVNTVAPQKFNQKLENNIDDYYHLLTSFLNGISGTIRKPAISKILSTSDYLIHRSKIRGLIENAEMGKENCLTLHAGQQYDVLIKKLKSLQKLLTIIEEMSLEVKRLSTTNVYSDHVAKTIDLLAKIQHHPEKTTLSTYKRIFVLMDNLKEYFQNSPLPETRQEFVDRSYLHHLFLYTNDYIDTLFLLKDPIEPK